MYFERRLGSNNDPSVIEEADKNLASVEPQDIIKDPYILEFLDLADSAKYHESDLEEALISKLQDFLLSLEKDSPLSPVKNISKPKTTASILT